VIEYGAEWWSVAEPGIPLRISLPLIRPSRRWIRSSARPNQFARNATLVVGWLMIAGVHSIVWIFASSAALINRARWNSASSSHCG
jgi:hypothetical protein